VTGRLDVALDELSEYLECDVEARQKVKSALTYPMAIFVMSIATVVILVAWVLPRFTSFFEELDAELPLPTRMLLDRMILRTPLICENGRFSPWSASAG